MKKTNQPFVSAVVVAAGKGTRMNMEINKQYIDLCGKPVLARSLQIFEDLDLVREIILVVNEQDLVFCKNEVVDAYEFEKVKVMVAGGAQRQQSVYNGLLEVDPGCDIVVVHDGARPLVEEACVLESIHAAEAYGAAGVAVPVKDTIKVADPDGFVSQTLDRSVLWAIQTPQTFRYETLLEAHRRALTEGFTGTDDAVLAERLGVHLKLVMGSYRNIKITTREDVAIAEALLEEEDGYR